jgi:hypothetical protein
MATVDDGWQSITNLAASDGSIRPVILDWETAATEAAAEALRAAWLIDYLVVAGGVPKSWSNAHKYHDDAFALPTRAQAEAGEYAILVTSILGDATKTAVVNLPFPKDTALLVYVSTSGEDSNKVNTGSSELAAYMANFASGAAFISDGEHSAGNIVRGKRSGT